MTWLKLSLNRFSCMFQFILVPHFQGNEFLSVRFKALAKDALNSSHPVSAEVTTPEQVAEMFDSVSYEKVLLFSRLISFIVAQPIQPSLTLTFCTIQGASILLMLKTTLSEEAFRKGVIEYLKKYTGSNTENADLWNSLSQVTPSAAASIY